MTRPPAMGRAHSEGARADSDAAAVRRASRIVGWQITAAAAAIVALVVALSVAFIIDQSRPEEVLEKPGPGETKIYVDSQVVLVALITVGIFAIVVAGVLSWVVARRAVRPLGDALRLQRMFVADASHELRTPLTVLDARIQILQRRLQPGDELEADVADIRSDSRALIGVVSDLLLAVSEETPAEDADESTDVVAVVTETARSMSVLASERGIEVALTTQPHIRSSVPVSSIRRCVVALVDNAIAHSPNGSMVTVGLSAAKSWFSLVVSDNGSGIQGIDPTRIFDRFAHSNAPHASSGPQSGLGIGLSLVRDIVVRNGGTVELRETSENGTTFALTLPRV